MTPAEHYDHLSNLCRLAAGDVATWLTEQARLYPDGYPTTKIVGGMVEVHSINQAPFGCGVTLDLNWFEPLNAWIKRGGIGEL